MIRVENLPVSVFEAGSGMPIVGRGTLVQGRLEVVLHDGRVVGFDLGPAGGEAGPQAFEVRLFGGRQQIRQFAVITALSALRTRLLAATP